MIIKNNFPHALFFRYKLNGKIEKFLINAYSSIDIPNLTDKNQVVSNTYQRRLRHIEEETNKNLNTQFEIPGDPDFPVFTIVSSTSIFGTISPLGSENHEDGDSALYTMQVAAVPTLTSWSTGAEYGEFTPSATTRDVGSCYYLSSFLVDGTEQLSGVTGDVFSTSNYSFSDISASHTANAVFSPSAQTVTFTFTPNTGATYITASTLTNENWGTISPSGRSQTNSYNFLGGLIVNGQEVDLSGVTGTSPYSAASTYDVSVSANTTVDILFQPYEYSVLYTMTSSAVTFNLSAITRGQSGGTISPSGTTIATDTYYDIEKLGITYGSLPEVDHYKWQMTAGTGASSAITAYNVPIFTNTSVKASFEFISGTTMFTMTPETGSYLSALYVDNINQISAITADVSATTTYRLYVPTPSGHIVEPLFKLFGE
jgi:hypothetical protein